MTKKDFLKSLEVAEDYFFSKRWNLIFIRWNKNRSQVQVYNADNFEEVDIFTSTKEILNNNFEYAVKEQLSYYSKKSRN